MGLKLNNVELLERLKVAERHVGSSSPEMVLIEGDKSDTSPEVSVIVTTFGADQKLFNALGSIMNQDFGGTIEIIISYDRGTDPSTFNLIKDWMVNDWNRKHDVRIILHNNTTLFRDRELMIRNALGQYVSFLDYDNTYYPNRLSVQIQEMKEKKIHFSFCNQKDVDSEGNVMSQVHLAVPSKYKNIKSLLFQNFVDSNTIMIDRKFLEDYLLPSLDMLKDRFFNEIVEDYFYAMIASAAGHLNYLPLALGNYTYHSGNITSRLYESNSESEFIRIAWYNERVFKTLVAITLVNRRMNYCDGNVFSNFINVISEDRLQILSVNSGMITGSGGILLNLLRSAAMLVFRIPYITKRLRKRKDSVSR